jgi:acyl-CoA synthetase (NDP forming)
LQNLTDSLTKLFNARSIVMAGASSDHNKWGYIMLSHLISGGFSGKIYPLNPAADKILGLKVYKSISEIPEVPDLAVIVVPPPAVLHVVKDCVKKGIKTGIIITAGFAELGAEGAAMQKKISETAREGGMVFIGPNCNGVMSPWNAQHIQFPAFHVPRGNIGIISQSGNVMDVLARQIMVRGQGCSISIACGNEASLQCEDYLEYLGNERHTKVILCYIEGFRNGKRFIKVAKKVSKNKPIIMLKAGKTQAGAKAAASHTAAIAGTDAIFESICRQTGVIRAGNLDELVNIGLSFLNQPIPKGHRLGIVTAGGGFGVLAADICTEYGLEVVNLTHQTLKELDQILPPWWSHGNPVDLVAGSKREDIFKAIELVIGCPNVDSVLYMSLLPAMRIAGFNLPTDKDERARTSHEVLKSVIEVMKRFEDIAKKYNKPLVAASEYMWGTGIEEAETVYQLGQSNTVLYRQPHEAAQVLSALVKYGEYLQK